MSVSLLGVRIDQVTFDQAVATLVDFATSDRSHYVVTANPEMVIAAQAHDAFKNAINNASLVVPDGIGLLAMAEFRQHAAGRNLGFLSLIGRHFWSLAKIIVAPKSFHPLTQRVSGADLFLAMCQEAMTLACPVVLVGGTETERDGTVAFLNDHYKTLTVLTDPGAHDANYETEEEFARLVRLLTPYDHAILFIAYGHPKQELWMNRHRDQLPHGFAMGIGGTFSYYSGQKQRAPKILQSLGLEWLWRLVIEPQRLKRIITAAFVFPYRVFTSELSH